MVDVAALPGAQPNARTAQMLSGLLGTDQAKPAEPMPADRTKPARPTVPPALREYTRKWMDETADTPEFTDACRQYDEDLRSLFPGDEKAKKRSAKADRTRKEDRSVTVARVFRNAQQTLAMVCPYDYGFEWKERPQIAAPDHMFHREPKDQVLQQFAATLKHIQEVYEDEVTMVSTVRSYVQQAIWFRVAIMKVTFHRDFHKDPVSANRATDEQAAMARLEYLADQLMRGDITQTDAEYQEMQSLQQGLMAGGEIEVYQGLNATTIPLTRFRMDPRIRSWEDRYTARWMGEDLVMSRAEILTRWPYQPKEDGTWEGVHPDDLNGCDAWDRQGAKLTKEERDRRRKDRVAKYGTVNQDEDDQELFLVREVWSAIEGKVLWLCPGVDYPLDTWTPTKQGRLYFPYRILNLNDQPGTWYGRSDTELQSPIQSRINRMRSDDEKARWLAIGRGIYNTSLVDGQEAIKLGTIEPGKLKGINFGNVKDIRELVMWLQGPYDPKWFDATHDEEDMRIQARLPEQAMGETNQNTTATAINTANQGTAVAAKDKQFRVKIELEGLKEMVAEILLMELRPEEAQETGGKFTVWPKVYEARKAKQLEAQVHQQVNQQVSQAIEQEQVAAMMQGMPQPMPNPIAVDQHIAELTEQAMLQTFGLPAPLTREGMFRRVQVQVSISLNSQSDRQARVQHITQLLSSLTGLGLQPGSINLEPVGRLIASLMGEEDEMESIFKPDPNALVQMLAQIAQTDPQSFSPQAGMMLAKLGDLAKQYLARGAGAAGGQPGQPALPAPASAGAHPQPPPQG